MSKEKEKEKLQNRLVALLGEVKTDNEKIMFYLKGKKVGEADLPAFTIMEARHILADLAEVKEYDDFYFVKSDGTIRIKASEVKYDDLSVSSIDISTNMGKYEGIMYQFYRNKIVCRDCGSAIYHATYPHQKHLIEQLYKKP
jgi:hypothetical protein